MTPDPIEVDTIITHTETDTVQKDGTTAVRETTEAFTTADEIQALIDKCDAQTAALDARYLAPLRVRKAKLQAKLDSLA